MIATRAADNQCVVAYANLVGGNDGLVFDGGGFVAQNGRLVLEAPRYREGFTAVNVDLDRTRRLRNENTTWRDDQQIFAAEHAADPRACRSSGDDADASELTYPVPHEPELLPPGRRAAHDAARGLLRGPARRARARPRRLLREDGRVQDDRRRALRRARQPALPLPRAALDRRGATATLGAEAEKAKAREILRAFFMPSRYSSKETHAAAEQAAKDFDAPFAVVSIDDAFEPELARIEKMLQPGEKLGAMARQNVQARIRVAAHVDVGEQRRRASSCRRAT